MKGLKEYLITESKKTKDVNSDPINYVKNSADFYHGREQFVNLLEGKKAVFYHGTNVDFKKFDPNKAKKQRNDKFFGGGIFLTPTTSTASRYANANANNSLHISIIDKAKKIDKRLYAFMYDLYHKGNSTWRDPKHEDFIDKYEFRDVNMNEIADLVNKIPDSQSEKDYNKGDDNNMVDYMSLFSNTSSALDYYEIENLMKLGLGDYRPRILSVEVNPRGGEIFITNNQKEARNTKAPIVIVYSHDDLVDDVPEIIIRDSKMLKIIASEVID